MGFKSLVYKCACFTLVSVALLLGSCKEKDKNTVVTPVIVPKDHGSLTVRMSNEIDGQPIAMGSLTNTNAAGNKYSVDLLKYYISNFTLIKNDNSERNFGNHKFINAFDSTTCSFTFDSVNNGSYKAIRFYMGVDSANNHTLATGGDLDAINGMTWAWSTGYIFFKHEGMFRRNDTATGAGGIVYHYGLDANLVTVDIPVSQFEINGNSKVMYLKFDLNKLYASPTSINFTGNNFHQSTEVNDKVWLANMKGNFPSAFSFDKVQ